MKEPKVSVLILNWNNWDDTKECLESLSKIKYKNYEVFIMDNGSKDNSVAEIKKWMKKRVFGKKRVVFMPHKKNYGFAKGNNLAIKQVIKEGKSKYIHLLNNDAIVDKDFLGELVKVYEKNKKVGIAGSKVYSYGGNIIQSIGCKLNMTRGDQIICGSGELDEGQYEKIQEFDFVCGASLLISIEMLEKIGLMEENYFLYFDDPDWGIKVKEAGYKVVYVPKSKIWHKGMASIGKISGYGEYYATRNRIWFMRKYANSLEMFLFLSYLVLFLSYAKIAKYMLRKDRKEVMAGYVRGLRDGFGVNKVK